MPKKDSNRIDYMPGQAAFDALAGVIFPDMSSQALIDEPAITRVVALYWRPPMLHGSDRDRWELPEQIASQNVKTKHSNPMLRNNQRMYSREVPIDTR